MQIVKSLFSLSCGLQTLWGHDCLNCCVCMKYTGAQNKAGALTHYRDKNKRKQSRAVHCMAGFRGALQGAGCPNPPLGWDEMQGINEELISIGAELAVQG